MRKEKYIRFGLLFVMLLAASIQANAQSIYPEDGWWWNPDESGRGYLMERQQDTIFLTSFHYTEFGEPEWLTLVGEFVPDTESELIIGTMTGDVTRFTGGQCIGCEHTIPVDSTSVQNPAVLTFFTNQAATLEWPQETVNIERFFWSWEDSGGQLNGNWILVTAPAEENLSAVLANISETEDQISITDIEGSELGSIDLEDGEWLLSMNSLNESLPILVPETKRFFAGSMDGSSVVVMGLRVDDLPFANFDSDANNLTPDWTDETHSKNADPNFTEVFDDTQVKRLDFVVSEEDWQSMLNDMTETYGPFGQSTGGAGLADTEENPIFVPAEVFYNGTQWYRVGIRFKGNSSLQGSWQAGILKLSFKLDFDEFEDEYPEIDNQRFYGFKKLSLKNNYDDESIMREKVASDVFKNAGVPVSHTAFYTLYVDHGNGPEYFGLYTLVEEIDDTLIDTQFSSDDGNLYKPEEGSANFAKGTFDAADFEKKTNEDDEDWSDIVALFSALHADTASTAPATWRQNLEAVFDVDGFLKYLAVNQIIQNWDTYGRMPHNYYLYNNPDTGKLTWIPWDNNESLQTGKRDGALALNFSNLSDSEWPLIAKIYSDDVYRATYNSYLAEVMNGAFDTSTMQLTYDTYAALIESHATAEVSGYSFLESTNDFYTAVNALKSHASARAAAVTSYLNSQ